MNLKDAIELVPSEYRASPSVVYQKNTVVFCAVLASIKVHPAVSLYEVVDEKEPFFVYKDLRKTIVFHVK